MGQYSTVSLSLCYTQYHIWWGIQIHTSILQLYTDSFDWFTIILKLFMVPSLVCFRLVWLRCTIITLITVVLLTSMFRLLGAAHNGSRLKKVAKIMFLIIIDYLYILRCFLGFRNSFLNSKHIFRYYLSYMRCLRTKIYHIWLLC